MTQPLVSIIIPTYNRAHLISETLDSVLSQTYTNWECIVVDDGSTDNTDQLLKKYCDNDTRFKYYKRPSTHKPGGNGARNFGFEKSKGKYINWLDSDDFFIEEKLELQVASLENTLHDFSVCYTMMFDDEKKKDVGLRAAQIFSDNILEDYILFKVFWLTSTPLWLRSFLLENKLSFDESLLQSQDYDFHIRALNHSINYIPIYKPLLKVRNHSENMSLSLVQNFDKIVSNVKVKNYILNSNFKLSNSTINKVYSQMALIYRDAVCGKKMKGSLYVFYHLFLNIKKYNSSWYNRVKIITRFVIGFVLYNCFNKGYNYLSVKV